MRPRWLSRIVQKWKGTRAAKKKGPRMETPKPDYAPLIEAAKILAAHPPESRVPGRPLTHAQQIRVEAAMKHADPVRLLKEMNTLLDNGVHRGSFTKEQRLAFYRARKRFLTLAALAPRWVNPDDLYLAFSPQLPRDKWHALEMLKKVQENPTEENKKAFSISLLNALAHAERRIKSAREEKE